jgi:hypothetical protein
MMDFLQHADVSFGSDANIGQLCEELSNIYGRSIWYDTFKLQNKKWLWFVNDVVAAMKINTMLRGFFCSVSKFCSWNSKFGKGNEFLFFVMKSENIRTILKNVFQVSSVLFLLSRIKKTVSSYRLVKKQLWHNWKSHGWVTSVHKVLTSRHDCFLDRYTCDLDMNKRLTNCKLCTKCCSMHPYKKIPFCILYCTKKSHRIFWEPQCHCKLWVKKKLQV